MKRVSSFISLLALGTTLCLPLGAQTFNNDYYPQRLIDVEQFASGVSVALPDGEGFITVSSIEQSDGTRDAWLHHVDVDGNVVWSRSYGNENVDDFGHSVCLSGDGADVIVTGQAKDDLWLFRAEVTNGDLVWSRTFGDAGLAEQGNYVAAYEDGANSGYVAAGQVAGLEEIYVVRVLEDGTPFFRHRYLNGNTSDMPTSFHIRDGSAYITGLHDQPGALTSLFVFEVLLSNGFGGAFHTYFHTFAAADRLPMLAPTDDGGFMAAYTLDTPGPAPGAEIAVLRLMPDFTPDWERVYTGFDPAFPWANSDGYSYGLAIYQTDAGDYAVGGSVTSRAYASWLLIDSLGTPLDFRHYQDAGFVDPANAVEIGDSVMAMSMDDEGFLLKNHRVKGISLTRLDGNGEDTCDVKIKRPVSAIFALHNVADYDHASWGDVADYEFEIPDLDVDVESCVP